MESRRVGRGLTGRGEACGLDGLGVLDGRRGEVRERRECGLDVDEDIADGGLSGSDGVLDAVREGVGVEDAHGGVDADVHIDPVRRAVLAGDGFLDVGDAGNGGGGAEGLGGDGGLLGVEEFSDGVDAELRAVVEDDDGREEGGPVVGDLVAGAADDRDGDADEGGGGGDGVRAVMAGVGVAGIGAGFVGGSAGEVVEGLLDDDDGEKDGEGEGRGGLVGRADLVEGLDGDPEGRADNHGGDDESGEGLGLAVAVGMIRIGGTSGDVQAAPDDDRAEDVGEGFDAVGDEGARVAQEAGDELGAGERDVDDEAEQREADGAGRSRRRHGHAQEYGRQPHAERGGTHLPSSMRQITLITTGGTIEKTFDETTGELTNRRSVVGKMLARLRLADAELRVVKLMSKDSLDMTDADRGAIVEAVRAALAAPEMSGVVVLHGTDTLEQTGERVFQEIGSKDGGPRVPIVLTGAMRPYEMKRSDALQNLTESIFATGILPAGVYCVSHGRALAFPGVVKDRAAARFVRV